MGRPKKWPPVPRKHEASGQDRVFYDGKTVYLGPSGSAEARRRYAEWLATVAPPERLAPGRWLTLAEITSRWVVERGDGHSPTQRVNYLRAIDALLLNGRGLLRADQFGVAQLAAARRDMLIIPWGDVAGRARQGWCRSVVNRQVVRVRTIWRWAEESGLAPPGSWSHLRTLRALPAHDRSVRQTDPIRPATWEDVQAVVANLRSRCVRAMVLVQWWTGCRGGEVRGMTGAEVDCSGEDWVYRPSQHKNAWRGHERTVVLGPRAREALADFLPLSPGHVFLSKSGKPYNAATYGAVARRAALKAGLDWFRCLSLRHGARLRITREVSLDAARAALGHSSAQMTAQYARGADVQAAVDAARRAG